MHVHNFSKKLICIQKDPQLLSCPVEGSPYQWKWGEWEQVLQKGNTKSVATEIVVTISATLAYFEYFFGKLSSYEARRKDSPWIRCYFSNLDIFNGFEILLICLTMIKFSKNRFLGIQNFYNFNVLETFS